MIRAIFAGGANEQVSSGVAQLVWGQGGGRQEAVLRRQRTPIRRSDHDKLAHETARLGTRYRERQRLGAQGSYYASPIAADGRIIVASIDGKVTVFAAGGEGPKILHQADFKERVAATPAVVENNIYVRTPTSLYAFGK